MLVQLWRWYELFIMKIMGISDRCRNFLPHCCKYSNLIALIGAMQTHLNMKKKQPWNRRKRLRKLTKKRGRREGLIFRKQEVNHLNNSGFVSKEEKKKSNQVQARFRLVSAVHLLWIMENLNSIHYNLSISYFRDQVEFCQLNFWICWVWKIEFVNFNLYKLRLTGIALDFKELKFCPFIFYSNNHIDLRQLSSFFFKWN